MIRRKKLERCSLLRVMVVLLSAFFFVSFFSFILGLVAYDFGWWVFFLGSLEEFYSTCLVVDLL